MNFRPYVLRGKQKEALRTIAPFAATKGFHLAGGTALAIQLGHRRSVDLDGFIGERIPDPLRLAREMQEAGIPFVTGRVDRGTLYGTVWDVQVSFLEYPYPLLEPVDVWPEYGCPLASLDDIACMKLSALTQRGAKKGFVDLYALLLRHKPLGDLLALYRGKFGVADLASVLYALEYFDDAVPERLPSMRWAVNWTVMKRAIRAAVREVAAGPGPG
jgi:hypothetical protein